MSKKKKRSRKSTAARRRQAQVAQKPAARSPKVSKSAESARGSGGKKEVDFATEYHYVVSDLKRFAFLAMAMLATLVVLAMVVQ